MTERKWCAIDGEGHVGQEGLLGVAFYSDQSQEYLTDHLQIRAAIQWYAERGYTFLAHNAKHDLALIFWELRIPMTAVHMNGRFYCGEWRYKKRHPYCQLWDTYALSGNLPLESLGVALQTPKYPTPQRLTGRDPDRYQWVCEPHGIGECECCYALRDAEIIYRFVTELERTVNAWGSPIKRRLSSLSASIWRSLDSPAEVGIREWKIRRAGHRAFYGGRVETFKLGRISPCYVADVSSMYPSIMASAPYPDPAYLNTITDPHPRAVPIDCEGLAEVTIRVPRMYLPPLPYSYKGILQYPVGVLRGWWPLAELRYALTQGCIADRWHTVIWSSQNLYPFSQFISTMWAARQAFEAQGDPRALFAKLLMNNLSGRLGMNDVVEEERITPDDPTKPFASLHKDGWYRIGDRLYLTETREKQRWNPWANVMWAAQTTALGRVRLHRHLLEAGSDVLYCDTDSVFSRAPINGLGEGLGALRDKGFFPAVQLARPKMYAHELPDGSWQAHVRGVPTRVALEYIRTGHATYREPISPRQQQHRHILAGTWLDVEKKHPALPHRRTPVDPSALESDYGWTDTLPPVV